MKTCIDKTCEAVLCEECNDLKPSICGDRGLQFPKDACDVITFEGVEDVETKQGLCVDLTEGVHAYDGDGTEISYTVEPSEIGCCDVGEHEVTYTARGKGNKMLPSFCLGKPMLTTADCGLMTKVVTRLVTILQALPPKILGAVRTFVTPGSTFDPMEGVSGIDDNGKATEVTFEGRYDVEESGSIITINSDVEQSVKKLEVKLEPIQSLNGYDKPWVGGAGVNKFDGEWESGDINNQGVPSASNNWIRSKNYIAVAPSTSYCFVAENADFVYAFWYDSENNFISVDTIYVNYKFTTATSPQNANYCKIKRWTTTEDKRKTSVNYPSTATEYEPYSNICPISGHDSVDVTRTGKNLLVYPYRATSATINGITFTANSDGSVTVNGTASATAVFTLHTSMNLVDGDYILTGGIDAAKFVALGYFNSDSATAEDRVNATTSSGVRFFSHQGRVTYVQVVIIANHTVNNLVFKPMIRLASDTDDTYEPYQGNTYATALGRTVYGGTLDVVSGELVVDRAMVDLGSLTWSKSETTLSSYRFFSSDLNAIIKSIASVQDVADLVCTSYKAITFYSANRNNDGIYQHPNGSIGIYDITKASMSVADFKTAMNGVQLVYELATPQTIQLTPQQIDLLLGNNNVWSDGDVTLVYSKPFVNGSNKMDIWGVYPIIYHTEDECGNETTVIREIIAGDCDEESKKPMLCQGKLCCASLDCSEELPVVCQGTVCNAKIICSQTEITPQEA